MTLPRLAERITGISMDTEAGPMSAGMVWYTPGQSVWWQGLRSVIVLAFIAFSAISSAPYPIGSAAWNAVLVCAVACFALRLPLALRRVGPILRVFGLLFSGVLAIVLTLLSPVSGAIAFASLAVINVTELWSTVSFSVFIGGLTFFYLAGQLALGRSLLVIVIGPAAIAAGALLGFARRQNAALAAEAGLVRESQARSAALDERARIAREIHDVLAHSLAALTVQLETADALLESGRTEQAHKSVLRAGQLAREGLAETRRAIGALRGESLPLPLLLRSLTDAYQADLGTPATLVVEGEERELRPDVSLTLYRTAQEATTNARKHAPKAPLSIELHYGAIEMSLDVTNGAAPDGDRPLASTGGGYGLTGLRERAELAGGTIEAGPVDDGWRVSVRIPE
ncbi:MAG TPA: histidine kinase [Micromonosporaceae bacterium]